jgi:predicted amidophosphoribosyltransferase
MTRATIAAVLRKLIDLLVPPLCIACNADAGRGAPLCRECRARMQATSGGWVPVPAGGSAGAAAGGPAAGASASAHCWTGFAYEGPAGALVRALKFGGRVAIADVMAAQLAALAPPEYLCGVVVPVPAHPAHCRRRGVDHSGMLARAFARRTGLPLADCLVRRGDAAPQVGRGRRARMGGPAGSIEVRPRVPVPGVAVIVDDVVTTGATMAACIGALRAAGTKGATPIAYARTTAR